MNENYVHARQGFRVVAKGTPYIEPHKCRLPDWRDSEIGVGALVVCEECGRYWRAKYNPFAPQTWMWSRAWWRRSEPRQASDS